MRNTKVWRLIISLLLLSPFVGSLSWAQLESGKVYNFVNVGNSGNSMVISGNGATITTTNTDSYSQLWYAEQVETGVFTLRNLSNGRYLRSSNTTSGPWTLVEAIDDNCKFAPSAMGDGYTLRTTNDNSSYGYMHYSSTQGCVVCWENSAATQWNFNVVEVDANALTENWATLDALLADKNSATTYQTALDALFTDQSCSALNATYSGYTTAQMQEDSNYKALPSVLQTMVLKMTTDGSWAETNYDGTKSGWDADYAKKYRVQLYEPYNEPGAAASALGLNAHTNMNNPTGIFVNYRGTVYVMVEGTIKDGSSLYLAAYTGHGKLGNYNDGVELHEGLNIVNYFAEGTNLCINYVVHTFDTSKGKGNKAKAYKLSDYDPIKIHIEGGYINGYYNKMGDELYGDGDKNTNWDYIAERATQKDVTILGKYINLQFPLNDADTEGNKGLGYYLTGKNQAEAVIDEWDKVMLWERLVLGVLPQATIEAEAQQSPYSTKKVFEFTGNDGDDFATDYSDYYNVHGLSFGVGGSSYMYGSWDHCGYHYNTMGGVIEALPTSAGAHWGPGHEIGHQHQSLLTVNGLTEVTNNLFSNVVLWYFGETTSRYNGDQGSLTNVLEQYNTEGADFFSNNIWAQTIMYYKLFLYYHVLGNNPKFYPRLFEMLRQDPMSGGYAQDGSQCLMKFYKKCCDASGDDLTEFFRAHGFFEVMENRYVGDYSPSVYNLTQAQIDAAIEEVKAKNYPENLAVLFVNDATGETIQSYKGDNLETYGETTICAEVGSYATYTDANVASEYTYTMSGNTITMEGTGGVGFAILNENGEIIGFSDKKTFEISSEAAALIASGKAKVVVANQDNSEPVEATDIMSSGTDAEQREVLGELLAAVKAIVDLSDDTGKRVGWYRKENIADLTTAYTAAKTVYEEMTAASYKTVYNSLLQAYTDVLNDGYAKIGIVEGTAYRLVNKLYPTLSMAVDVNDSDSDSSTDEMFGLATDESSDAQLWYFEAGSTNGTYYLKNKSTSNYPGNVSSGAILYANQTASSSAYAYTFHDLGDGSWALSGSYTGVHCSASQSNNIVGWGWEDTPSSHWYITAVEENADAANRAKLADLIAKTESLVDEMADVTYRGDLDMSACRITSNATEPGHETNYLVDGNTDTYFHTVWKDSEVAEDHYFQIDLGDGKTISEFVLKYTNIIDDWSSDYPASIAIIGSADGELWNAIATLDSGLPTTKGGEYTSATLGSSSNPYRYLRFTVTNTTSQGQFNGHYYFGLAEVSLNIPETHVSNIYSKYTSVLSTDVLTTACEEVVDATLVYDNAEAGADAYDAAYQALYAEYEKLQTAYNNANNANLDAKKAELENLITLTNNLIAECATSVTHTPATYNGAPTLQTTDDDESFYISTNAQSTQEGEIKYLVDGKNDTYFHSDYSGNNSSDGLDHHLTVNLGAYTASSFTFNYVTRHNADANYPATIAVYGSTDGTNYGEPIATCTSLPAEQTQSYTSETITSATKYKYLRFMVTANNNNNLKGGHPIFHMAEFGLNIIGNDDIYTVQLEANSGSVTEELVVSAYREKESAAQTLASATTEAQLIQAIGALQEDYDALNDAKNNISGYRDALQAKIDETKALINACGTINSNGEVTEMFETAGDATEQQLLDAYNEVLAAEAVVGDVTTTIDGYIAATEALETDRAALEAAKNGTKKSTLRTLTANVTALITLCETTPGDVTQAMIDEITAANTAAIALLETEDFDAIVAATTSLQTQYDAMSAAQQSTAKTELRALIAQMETLMDQCGTVEVEKIPVVGEALALTTTENADFYVSTNADQNTGGGDNDGDGIAALVDNDTESYFHTRWGGEVVNEAHYIQIDLGDANLLSDFKFSFLPRSGSPTPTAMTVYGSNDASSFTEILANITSGFPEHNSGQTYTSDAISSLTKYRYLRFTVTDSRGPGNNTYGGQKFFGMKEFDLYPITSYNTEYAVTMDPNVGGSVTKAQLQEAYIANADATELANNSGVASELTAKKEELQAVYDALLLASQTNPYPVTITTDVTAPVLYTMKSRRGDAKAVQYLPADGHKFNISDTSDGSAAQAFYFTEGDERGQVYVHPYAAGNMVLAANDTGNGADKAFAAEKDAATNNQWKFVTRTVGEETWYNLQPVGTETYFSNFGGVDYKMGFYSDSPASDDGSLFQFASTTVDGSAAYNSLKTYYDGLALSHITGGDAVGYYPEAQATAYNDAYNQAAMLLTYGGTPEVGEVLSAEDLVASTTALTIGINSASANIPNKWVNELGFIYNFGTDKVAILEPVTEGQAGTYYLKMVHAGEYGYFQSSGYSIGAKETAQVFVPITASTTAEEGSNAYFDGNNLDESDTDATKLVRFVCGSADGTSWLYPANCVYNNNTGSYTVYNVHAVNFSTPTDEQYLAAYNALKAANEALAIKMPEEGKFYTIESVVYEDGGHAAMAYANPADNKMYWGGGKTAASPEAIWTFADNGNGTYTVSNLHTGTMMNGFIYYDPSPLNTETSSVTLTSLAHDGQLGFHANGTMMHAQGGGAIVHWGTGANAASAWRIVEVEDMSAVKFELTIGQYEHAGMYLNYPVTIPEGVVVKYPNDIEVTKAEGGKVTFAQVEEELPARTGVIVEAPQGTYTFYYNTNPTTEIQDNLLLGSAYTAYLPGETNWSYYLFGVKNGVVGFYMAYLEYNEDGSQTVYDGDGNAVEGESLNDTDNGTHFRVGANKVYLPYDYSLTGTVAMFGFGDMVTDIDGVETDNLENATIFDLSGRRIERITTSGVYIVNGKKQYIRASQMK